jgi:hypothetical protein
MSPKPNFFLLSSLTCSQIWVSLLVDDCQSHLLHKIWEKRNLDDNPKVLAKLGYKQDMKI